MILALTRALSKFTPYIYRCIPLLTWITVLFLSGWVAPFSMVYEKLLVHVVKPHRGISRDTVARWIQITLAD